MRIRDQSVNTKALCLTSSHARTDVFSGLVAFVGFNTDYTKSRIKNL